MASSVATPLEKQFSTIAGIDSMTSTSALGAHADHAPVQPRPRTSTPPRRTCRRRSRKAAPLLPPGMPTPPSYRKVNPADQPVLYLALSSPTLPLYTVDEYAETNLAQRISMITGVAQVQVFGSQKYAVRVQLDPRALAPAASASTRSSRRIAPRQRESADRHALRPAPDASTSRRTGSSRTPRPSARSSWPTATARRCGSRSSGA